MSSRQNEDDETAEEFHPSSKWQEPPGAVGNGGLTLYDTHRKPRTVTIDPSHRSRIPLTLFHPEFRCVICFGYMTDTVMLKECMHRFCRECIMTAIRQGRQKECPTCRVRIASKRDWKADARFDELMQSVLGNVQEQEKIETQQAEETNRNSKSSPVTWRSRRVVGKRRNSGAVGPERKSRRMADTTGPAAATIQDFEPSPLVEFLLARHADETTLDALVKDNLRMSGDAPVSVLQSFLRKKLSHEGQDDIQICTKENAVLSPWLLLKDVKREFCSYDDTMVLYFRL